MSDAKQMVSLHGTLKENEPMSRHVSWRAGGAARLAYFPADVADLCAFIASRPRGEAIVFVGLGSNLLVRDAGFDGTIVILGAELSDMRVERDEGDAAIVYMESGAPAPKAARFAANAGLHGLEFWAGIPGSVGGTLAMNAGCYGSETWPFVESVVTVNREGRLVTRTPHEFEVGYRHVALKHGSLEDEWFVAGRFRLAKGDDARAKAMMKELLAKRAATQPLTQPNAGSVFRNPPGDFAARLIETCGLKGFTIGGAQVSPKHANFIVNLGGASAADIEALIVHVQETVKAATRIELVREVRIIGKAA